jgi:putative hemolysin
MIEIAILLVLLLLNGIFAMGEIAMVSSRKSRLEERAKRGNPGAKAALILLAHPERLLSTVQVGITSIGTVAGAFGGIAIAGNFAKYLVAFSVTPAVAEPVSMVVVVGSITFLSLVFGELVPKSIALNNPEPVAMVAAPILVVVATITQPLVRFLAWITSAVLRMLGISNKRAVPVSEAEFKLMIDEGVHHGVIEHQESEMLKGIFRFDDRKAQSLMTHRQHLAWIDINASPRQIRAQILESEYTKFLVCEEQLDKIVGVLLVKDYLRQLDSGREPNLRELVSSPLFIPENMSGLKILEKFREDKRYVGVVVSEHGVVEGWITLRDLIESIVGELPDSDDPEVPDFVRREDGSWLVDGAVLLDELQDQLNLDGPDQEDRSYSTLGGLMMDQLNKVPKEGDYFVEWGYRFEVVDMDGHRVDKVWVIPVVDPVKKKKES